MTQAKHTQFAMKALDMAEMFKLYVGATPVKGNVPYAVELGKPDGPSTGGGKQSLQPIKLIPQGDGTTLVAGHANQVDRKAELRTYEFVTQSHAQRFPGAEFPIQREAYNELLGKLEKFFKDQLLQVTRLQPEAPAQASSPVEMDRAGRPGRNWLVAAGAAIVMVSAAAAAFFAR